MRGVIGSGVATGYHGSHQAAREDQGTGGGDWER